MSPPRSIQSPVAGYFVSQADGLRGCSGLRQGIAGLTTEEVDAALNAVAQGGGRQPAVGKVVGDYEWYLACVLSAGRRRRPP